MWPESYDFLFFYRFILFLHTELKSINHAAFSGIHGTLSILFSLDCDLFYFFLYSAPLLLSFIGLIRIFIQIFSFCASIGFLKFDNLKIFIYTEDFKPMVSFFTMVMILFSHDSYGVLCISICIYNFDLLFRLNFLLEKIFLCRLLLRFPEYHYRSYLNLLSEYVLRSFSDFTSADLLHFVSFRFHSCSLLFLFLIECLLWVNIFRIMFYVSCS